VAIDRTSKFAFARLVESAGKMEAAQFLRELVKTAPHKIHTVLTDNSIQFTTRKRDIYDGHHIFDRLCDEHGIEHRLTKVKPSLDQRAGRADEPHPQGTARADPLRVHLPRLDQRTGTVQAQPVTPHSGTKQVGSHTTTFFGWALSLRFWTVPPRMVYLYIEI
jgi:hypothetical protein